MARNEMKCERCGREAHEDRFGIDGGEIVCDVCLEKKRKEAKR